MPLDILTTPSSSASAHPSSALEVTMIWACTPTWASTSTAVLSTAITTIGTVWYQFNCLSKEQLIIWGPLLPTPSGSLAYLCHIWRQIFLRSKVQRRKAKIIGKSGSTNMWPNSYKRTPCSKKSSTATGRSYTQCRFTQASKGSTLTIQIEEMVPSGNCKVTEKRTFPHNTGECGQKYMEMPVIHFWRGLRAKKVSFRTPN